MSASSCIECGRRPVGKFGYCRRCVLRRKDSPYAACPKCGQPCMYFSDALTDEGYVKEYACYACGVDFRPAKPNSD
jgi:hypothetical protein